MKRFGDAWREHMLTDWPTTAPVRFDFGELALLRAGLAHLSGVDTSDIDDRLAMAQHILTRKGG